MNIDTHKGLIEDIPYLDSPNQDARPEHCTPELLVIHNISLPPGQYGGQYIDQLFTNRLDPDEHPYFQDIHQLQVSSHVLIRRNGKMVQYVPFHCRAWHAGESSYCGRDACNDFSIGIELEGTDEQPFEDIQYQELAKLILALWQNYPDLPKDAITGHSDIAPGRKTDPGPAFDWEKLKQLLKN